MVQCLEYNENGHFIKLVKLTHWFSQHLMIKHASYIVYLNGCLGGGGACVCTCAYVCVGMATWFCALFVWFTCFLCTNMSALCNMERLRCCKELNGLLVGKEHYWKKKHYFIYFIWSTTDISLLSTAEVKTRLNTLRQSQNGAHLNFIRPNDAYMR